ncbi:PREDICTED: protein STRUBBELIG-RECEPTOR FAMILY 2 [Populus euphratica]|uniref:Protein STRUBBELIG-RECEPTOR FAMILY 2 n=1 Tax=Populus euphratica TaxID=75702 RepID=A0AAJ6X492_POPEU|nr:PREDICTED: protein STRUBBELIG-RECEPTOR FAMILY 2 [Populus euphratica]XP_011004819.1 PREDICTED: protein STRUBBELIG-RECEPTOR FAMILY 2 [Populus euphratica]
MASQRLHWGFVVIVFLAILSLQASASTDASDVIALQDLYKALSNPPQLKEWRLDGGDPCGESWTGVSCAGPSVIHLKLQGLNLRGFLGTQLHYLHSLRHLDVSFNYIAGEIPYALPPNATHINLAYNYLSQSIPLSLPGVELLWHLNLSHNSLSGPIGNVFTGLQNLKEIDLSYNNFTGDLPSSFGSLTNLTKLFLQNNQFTGSVVYLANLSLTDLNIQTNHFSGVIPTQFQLIPDLWIDGNQFHIEANYPPWNYPLDNGSIGQNFNGPPTTESSAMENYLKVNGHKKKRLGPGGIVFVVGVVALVVTCAAIFIAMHSKRSRHSCSVRTTRVASEVNPQLLPPRSPSLLFSTICHNRNEKNLARKSFSKYEAPVSAKIYTVTELQLATNNFGEENLLGEGSLGSVYRAEFQNGQIFVVKNINTVSLSFQEEEKFLDVIWTASRLRHPNIVTLIGYCVEHGQHLLVYDYIRDLSLHDVLHGDGYKPLSWNIRLTIALGVARALEFLHSTFSPPVSHGNVKAANVLLDKELVPRLCDTGLAILRPLTSNSVKIKASEIAIGDTGYIAPEHGEPVTDNTKSDIYAFGVLLLELLTGRRPFDGSRPRAEQSLVKWALSRLHDNESLIQMVDPGIKRTLPSKILSRFADIVLLCIQPDKFFRPPMSEIVSSMTSVLRKFTAAESGAMEGAEADPFERSFCSTYSRFITSPTPSYISV